MENGEKGVGNCEIKKKEVIYGHAGDDSIDEDESTEEETCGEDEAGWVGRLGGVGKTPTTYIQLTLAGSMII